MALTAYQDRTAVHVHAGQMEIRLAESAAEVEAAQALRYRVFYEEMSAHPTPEMARSRRDFDFFDAHCDHLIVLDRGLGAGAVVATYRLLRREGAARCGRFYTGDEYEIGRLLAVPGEILELGRSCVDARYRTGPTMQLLWRGIAEYVQHYEIGLMFGCASLPGTDPKALALPLSYLAYNHVAPEHLRPRAVAERYEEMRLMPPEAVDARAALAALPPLIKGYLRLGGFVGDGAVVDPQFHTTDVCVVVKTDLMAQKYYRHYTREDGASRFEEG
ncbi:MAG: ornithine-acyl N-acyltransferase [Rhodospirillales bacterium]|jgi:putative hemolysin|nr:ornithine-acyl N-acyltransferase [Rhodospirillales bacterium]